MSCTILLLALDCRWVKFPRFNSPTSKMFGKPCIPSRMAQQHPATLCPPQRQGAREQKREAEEKRETSVSGAAHVPTPCMLHRPRQACTHATTLPLTRSFSPSSLSRASRSVISLILSCWSAGAHARARTGAAISRLERGLQAPQDRQSAGNVARCSHPRTRRRARCDGNLLPLTRSRVYAHTQVNLESRQYVIPDEKRRDDVRWQARVMMHS